MPWCSRSIVSCCKASTPFPESIARSASRAGFKISGANPSADSPPPRLGEHTDEILQSLGYDSDEIDGLRKARAI